MKTIKKSMIAVTVFTLLSMSGYASIPFIKIKNYDAKKFSLIVHATSASPVHISLKDDNDYEFYSESLMSNEGYGKKFNLQSLPDGNYYLQVENKEMIQIFSLSINSGLLAIHEDSKVVLYKPQVIQQGNKVAIALDESVEKPLDLEIKNWSNDIIYADSLSSDSVQEKTYDLSRLEPGIYTMSLSISGRSFTKSLYIK